MICDKSEKLARALHKQIEIMARLRAPENGCPWDLAQDFDTIAPFTIEEAYEVADAIKKRDFAALKEELGDLVFQVAFHSRMAEEAELFDFVDVVEALNRKMVARHEHVFGDNQIATPEAVLVNWENLKAEERAAKLKTDNSILADVAIALPALSRAWKLSKRAARVGFDWTGPEAIFEKLNEEVNETKEAIESNNFLHIQEEIGDCLFVLVNLARKCDIDPENALRLANDKFEKRFRFIETELAKLGKSPQNSTIDEMEGLWLKAKMEGK